MILYKTKTGEVVNVAGSSEGSKDYLSKTNKDEYSPTDDYNPATKKYVDDLITDTLDTIKKRTINDYYTLEKYVSFTDSDIVAKDIEDVSDLYT